MTTSLTLTDGGLETVLIFEEGFDLPCFAAFPLLEDDHGRAALRRYYEPFLEDAQRRGLPLVLETPTWRANPDWIAQLGYDDDALTRINETAVAFTRELVGDRGDVKVSGAIGPRGDGYVVGETMSAEDAAGYHSRQVGALGSAGVDQVTAMTLTYAAEAIGVVRAATARGIPTVIGFTIETDGRLPDGTRLAAAIDDVDAATDAAAAFYMVNCAYPSHVAEAIDGSSSLERIGALRVNGANMSHAELDEAEQLHAEPPETLAADVAALQPLLPGVKVLGGCCGTDHRHVAAIADAWLSASR